MSEQWPPSVRIWPYRSAPKEFLDLYRQADIAAGGAPEEGDEELLIYVPREMLGENGDLNSASSALWFLDWRTKTPTQEKYAGDDWGSYSLLTLPDGGRIAVTRGSEKMPS